jgi:hypothetical protein
MYKESILLVGGDSTGKTSTLFEIARHHPEARIILLDLENKSSKIHDGLYPDVTVDTRTALTWDDLEDVWAEAKASLKPGDWFMVDGLHRAWDMVQTDYEVKVHDLTPSERIEKLRLGDRKDAAGIDKWGWCKGKHNSFFMDIACFSASFHVAMTTQVDPWVAESVDNERDDAIKEQLLMWRQFGFKPAGEKHNVSRFDTVFALASTLNPVQHKVATYKDKVRPYLSGGKRSLWAEREWPLWTQYVRACEEAKERGEPVIMPE